MGQRDADLRLHRASAAMLRWEEAARRLRRGSYRRGEAPPMPSPQPVPDRAPDAEREIEWIA